MKLLFFRANWCTACCAIASSVPAETIHIDCDEDQETPTKYGIASLPVFIATDDEGNELARTSMTNMPMLRAWYGAVCNKHADQS